MVKHFMIGVSSLNMNNPFVLVMEKEYVATRKALVAYTRKSITVMVILSIIDIIAGIFTGNYFLYSFMLISSDIFLWITLKNTIRDTNLKKVNEIVFGEDYNIYKINEEDVYNTTRTLCTMRGNISGNNRLLNFNIMIHILIIVSTLIQFFLERFGII